MLQEAPNLFIRETPYHIFMFPARRARAPPSDLRQINSAILKVPGAAWSCSLDTYVRIPASEQFRVPMEPPMSNSSMQHRGNKEKSMIIYTRMILAAGGFRLLVP